MTTQECGYQKQKALHVYHYQFLMQCREPMIATFPVLTETLHLLMRREQANERSAKP